MHIHYENSKVIPKIQCINSQILVLNKIVRILHLTQLTIYKENVKVNTENIAAFNFPTNLVLNNQLGYHMKNESSN